MDKKLCFSHQISGALYVVVLGDDNAIVAAAGPIAESEIGTFLASDSITATNYPLSTAYVRSHINEFVRDPQFAEVVDN